MASEHVRAGIGSDERIGKRFLYPGVGYGGSCFPKDIKALIRIGSGHDLEMRVLAAVDQVNTDQKRFMVKKIKNYYGKEDLSKEI